MSTITLRTTTTKRTRVKARFGTVAGNQGNAHLPPTSTIEWNGIGSSVYQVYFFDLDIESEPPVWPFTDAPDGQDLPWPDATVPQSYLRVQGPATPNKQKVTLSGSAPPRIKYYVRSLESDVAPLDPVLIIRHRFDERLLSVIVTSIVIGAIVGAIATALMISN